MIRFSAFTTSASQTARRLSPVAIVAVSAMLAAGAATFPRQDLSTSKGLYEGVYFVIRDVDAAPLSAGQIAQIQASSEVTRQFYAANSGGFYDLRYTQILDVPLALNADGTRIGDWIADAENYVRSTYGIEPEDFHANVFDVSGTKPDPDQGWSGLAWIPSNNFAVQADISSDWGQIVMDHELGHRIGVPHAGALRAVSDSNYTPYYYDFDAGRYDEYSAAAGAEHGVPFGVHNDEYGNPFDVMGNISHGHFNVHEKLTNLQWLTPAQAPDLNQVGEGTYRIYAHDELQTVYNSRLDIYGVTDTYEASSLYGLTYTREAERFDVQSGQFTSMTQEVTLEYRAGRDGIQLYLGDSLIDLDPEGGADRNNLERELEVGDSIREIDFGVSFYASTGDGDDFLSHNPPAPARPWEVLPEWFEFSVLGLGSDSTGSYVDVLVSREDYAIESGVAADLNRDGMLDRADWLLFASLTHSDLSGFNKTGRYLHGDFNDDGANDYDDFLYFKETFIGAHGAAAFAQILRVPEPTSLTLLGWLSVLFFPRKRAMPAAPLLSL